MKLKWFWIIIPIIVGGIAAILAFVPNPPAISTRLLVRTNTPDLIFYEITNQTQRAYSIQLLNLEMYHERTGWWPVSLSCWFSKKGSPLLYLPPSSQGVCEIGLPSYNCEGSALRGNLSVKRVERQWAQNLRISITSKLKLSRLIQIFSPTPGIVQLPVAEIPPSPKTSLPYLQIESVPLASTNTLTPASSKNSGAFNIKIFTTELREVLDIYAEFANAKLEIDPRIRTMNNRMTIQSSHPLSYSAAISLFEQALQNQAGIKVRHRDQKHIKLSCSGRSQ